MDSDKLLSHLISLAEEVSLGRYGRYHEIFELTKAGRYPVLVTQLAEAFGMMMVKIEAREFHLEQIIEKLRQSEAELFVAREALKRENVTLKRNLKDKFSPARILGVTREIKDLIAQIERVADTPVNVLVTGETGTGKELVAKALHFNSGRSSGPFVAINCSAIPEPLFEAELFGIERGVATGVEKRIGRMQQASGGTLFLDEIGDMPLASQAKMLRALEERTVEPVGGRTGSPVDIRIIAATNKDLKAEVEKKTFREDLFYRLNVVHLRVPPLRERRDDIPVLLEAFLKISILKLGRPQMTFSAEAIATLKQYPWPGNVRELENEVERAVALAYEEVIGAEDLSDDVRLFPQLVPSVERITAQPTTTRDMERQMILDTMRTTNGNKSRAAKALGISREGLRKKMKRYGIGEST